MALFQPQPCLSEAQEPVEISLDINVFPYTEPKTVVDGGIKAWTVLIGSSCVIYATYGLLTSNGLFMNYWATHQLSHYSSSEVGWITAVHVFLALFLGGQSGILFDKYGHQPLLLPGSLLYVGGLFFTGECTQFWQFMLAYGVLAGVGCGIISSVALAVVVHWFDKKRGLAMGVVFMGSSLGGVTFPFIMRAVFESMSWAHCMRVIGSIVSAMLLVGIVCIKRPLTEQREGYVDFKAFIDPKFIFVTTGLGMFEFALFGTLGLLPEVAQHLNYSLSTRFNVVAVMNGCSGLGRLTCGLLSDRIGCYNVIILSASCSLLSIFAFWLPSEYSVVLLYLFAVNFGFWSGSMISIGPTCVAQLCKVEQYGQYYGTSYSITSFVNLICVPIGSRLLVSLGMKGFASFFGAMLFISIISLSLTSGQNTHTSSPARSSMIYIYRATEFKHRLQSSSARASK